MLLEDGSVLAQVHPHQKVVHFGEAAVALGLQVARPSLDTDVLAAQKGLPPECKYIFLRKTVQPIHALSILLCEGVDDCLQVVVSLPSGQVAGGEALGGHQVGVGASL